MALNQIGFFVLPKESLDKLLTKNHFELDEEGYFDDELIWKKYKRHYSLFNLISEILRPSVSWSKNILLYGDENSNRFEVLFDQNNIILSVSFRIDFTSNYEIILIRLLDFFKSNDLIVIDGMLNLVELEYKLFEEIILSFQGK